MANVRRNGGFCCDLGDKIDEDDKGDEGDKGDKGDLGEKGEKGDLGEWEPGRQEEIKIR